VANSPRDTYLSLFDEWEYNLSLNSQWILLIHSFPTPIIQKVRDYESLVSGRDWNFSTNYEKAINSKVQFSEEIGCFFIDNVTLPGDGFSQEEASVPFGGFNVPGMAGKRTPFAGQRIGTRFKETNVDFVETVLRPWMISCSYKGFFAYENENERVKCPHMQIIHFSRYRHARSAPYNTQAFRPIRKIYNFYNVAPVEIGDHNYTYDEDSAVKLNSVGWVFDNRTTQFSQ